MFGHRIYPSPRSSKVSYSRVPPPNLQRNSFSLCVIDLMYPAPLPLRRRLLFPPLPEDPISDSSFRGSEIISCDSSSEDDDTEKAAKRRRMLKHAESYLRGEPLYLHSARLRGPVTKNPWGKPTKRVKRKDSGEKEGEGGAVKWLKRYEEDGNEIPSTPTRVNKGKGILTSRGINTFDDVMPETSAPTPLQMISSATTHVPDRSHSPVSKVNGNRNYTSGPSRRNSPFDISRQTDYEAAMASPFKTPVKKKPKRGPIEVPPVCSPGTFYSRTGKPRNLTLDPKPTISHQRSVGTSYTPPQENTGSSLKPTPSISARKDSEGLETVLDTIDLAKPAPSFPDVDMKKKRAKIDFTTKSPFVKSAPTRTKAVKGSKKKRIIDKKSTMDDPQSAPVLGVETLAPRGPEHDVGTAGEANKDPGEILNDWLNRHVTASQNVQAQVSSFSRSRLNTNPTTENLNPATSILPETSAASMPSITAEPVEILKVSTLPTEKILSRSTGIITLSDTLQTPPPLEVTVVPLPKLGLAKTRPTLPPNPDKAAVPQPPTPKSQPPESTEQAQPETTNSEMYLPEAEEQLQSPTFLWQNTQYQVLAAQKGFFDALKDSPGFGPFITAETPGRDLLRPISFFDNEIGTMETPRLDDREINGESIPSSFKTPGFTGMSTEWRSADRFDRDAFASPFKTTFGKGGDSLLGTAFTPFRAFATPESSPKPTTERTLSPLAFSSPEEQTQEPNDPTKIGNLSRGGFGLLDDDDDDDDEGEQTDGSVGGGFSPACFREPGQQGAEEGEQLVDEVMGFMGGGVWDIDEELKKMAKSNTNTSDGIADSGKKGNRRGGSAKKRRLYGRRT